MNITFSQIFWVVSMGRPPPQTLGDRTPVPLKFLPMLLPMGQ